MLHARQPGVSGLRQPLVVHLRLIKAGPMQPSYGALIEIAGLVAGSLADTLEPRQMTSLPERDLAALGETFGSAVTGPMARRQLVRKLFDRVAPRYDLMNDLMSFGLHRPWKRTAAAAVSEAVVHLTGPVVDLAGGTGDLSKLIAAKLHSHPVINIDASPGMIAVAARRLNGAAALTVAEAERLPLTNRSVAAICLSFGLRNMTDPQQALREAERVLKPGGTLVLLEFSKPYSWFEPVYDIYSRLVIPALGAAIAGDRRAYRYLVESIRRFPDADSMTEELTRAGFGTVTVRRLMFGVAALHVAVKS